MCPLRRWRRRRQSSSHSPPRTRCTGPMRCCQSCSWSILLNMSYTQPPTRPPHTDRWHRLCKIRQSNCHIQQRTLRRAQHQRIAECIVVCQLVIARSQRIAVVAIISLARNCLQCTCGAACNCPSQGSSIQHSMPSCLAAHAIDVGWCHTRHTALLIRTSTRLDAEH
jgi:hypothetical protein